MWTMYKKKTLIIIFVIVDNLIATYMSNKEISK